MTDSQQLIFHMLGNKAKLDLQRTLPSQLPATTVIPNGKPTGFWEQTMHDNHENDVPPNRKEDDEESEEEEADDLSESAPPPRSRMPSRRRDRGGASM